MSTPRRKPPRRSPPEEREFIRVSRVCPGWPRTKLGAARGRANSHALLARSRVAIQRRYWAASGCARGIRMNSNAEEAPQRDTTAERGYDDRRGDEHYDQRQEPDGREVVHEGEVVCERIHDGDLAEGKYGDRDHRTRQADQDTLDHERPADEPVGRAHQAHDLHLTAARVDRQPNRVRDQEERCDEQQGSDHDEDDLDGPRDVAYLARVLAVVHVLDQRADRLGLARGSGGLEVVLDRLEVVGGVQPDLTGGGKGVAVELVEAVLAIVVEVTAKPLQALLLGDVVHGLDVVDSPDLILELLDLRKRGVGVEEDTQPDLLTHVRRLRLARSQDRDQHAEQERRDDDRHDRRDAGRRASAERPEGL